MKATLTPIATAVAFALSALPALAQQAAPAESKVIVTGIRAALESSLNQKKGSESLVEVITAEDVGKMPDKNVADSLQRLPGVNIATAGGSEGGFGENDRVSLRGTPSFMTLTTLNGHTVSSGDWYVENITGGGRSVSYSLFPSQLIGRVTVYKTSQANLVEGGGVGTVDIETRRPLGFRAPLTLMGSVEGAYTQASGKTDPQLSGLVNWRNDAGTVGVMVQAFDEKRHLRRQGQEFLWWDKVDTWFAPAWVAANPEVKGKNISLLTGSVLFQQERHRRGGLVDVELKPTRDLRMDLSLFSSKMNADNINANFMLAPYQVLSNNWSGDANSAVPSSYSIAGNTITQLAFPATCPVADCSKMGASVQDVISRPGSYNSSTFANLDVDYKATQNLSFKGKLGRTEGKGHARDYGYEVWNAYAGNSISLNGLSAPATVTVDNAGTFSPRTGADFFGGWASDVTSTDREDYGQVDGALKLESDTFHTLRFGLRSATHKRSLQWLQGTLATGAGSLANAPTGGLTRFPGAPLPNMLDGAWTFTADSVNAWGDRFVTFANHAYQNEFVIRERANSAYVMSEFAIGKLTGNAGVRLVKTDVHVENGSPNTTWKPVVTDNSYSDVLPSLNLRYELSRDLIGRAALSRTLARPEIGSLGALSLQDIQRTGSGGNPSLKPVLSNNFDIGLEWYFAPKAMLSASLFALDMKSYVTYGSYVANFYNQSANAVTPYNMSAAVNTTAEVSGVELAYAQALAGGFGVNANYTYADGKETGKVPGSACATTSNCRMLGNSKNVYNLGAYYEDDRFNVRLAYSYRSDFLNGLNRNSAIVQTGVGTVSAALGYKISNQWQLSLEGKDLNDPVLKSYASSPDQPRAFYKNGRQFYLSLRATM